MPLRSILDGESVHSFSLSSDHWRELKRTYRSKSLVMPCCGHASIPKNSSKGTQFFAHATNSGCPYVAEPQELLLARMIVAEAVLAAGWEVTTEYRGDSGGHLIDVYAHNGPAAVAFQVQWRSTEMGVIREREIALRECGIRGAWLYRLYRNRSYDKGDLLEEHETPVFGIRISENGDGFVVPRFDTELEDFVRGMLTRQLEWKPRPHDRVTVGIFVVRASCWKCNQLIGLPVGIVVRAAEPFVDAFIRFHEMDTAELLASLLDMRDRKSHRIGAIEVRFSRTVGSSRLLNSCFSCGAGQGMPFVDGLGAELLSLPRLPRPQIEKTLRFENLPSAMLKVFEPSWFFRGLRGRWSY